MRETIRELISEEKVNERIRELGAQISKDYAGKSVRLVCILKGACIFMCELAKRITVPVSMDFMTVSSYGSGTKSSGIVRIKKAITLLDKPERRVVDLKVDYTGFEIPDQFVVGYGMDYDQRYRDLPFIGVVEFEVE